MKTAIITGATGGVGEVVAKYFVKNNYRVALIDIDHSRLDMLKNKLIADCNLAEQQYPLIHHVDVSDYDAVATAMQQIMIEFDRVDVLFNGAGIAMIGGTEMNPDDFKKIIAVNLIGIFNCIHAVVPHMKKQQSGYIFNVASRQGKMGGNRLAGYASSKHGVMGLNDSVLKELLESNIKVTALCPSYINTPMMDLLDFPKDKMLKPADVVEAVDFLLRLSPAACVREILIEIQALVS